jgi:hypothetical protein
VLFSAVVTTEMALIFFLDFFSPLNKKIIKLETFFLGLNTHGQILSLFLFYYEKLLLFKDDLIQ